MTTSNSERDSSNTISNENDELKHGKTFSDIRDGEQHSDGSSKAPDHGPETISEANQRRRGDSSSEDGSDDE